MNRKIGNSVERNFIKRKMRELFRLNRHHLTHGYYDLWIVAKEKFEKSDSPRIEALFCDAVANIERRGVAASSSRPQ